MDDNERLKLQKELENVSRVNYGWVSNMVDLIKDHPDKNIDWHDYLYYSEGDLEQLNMWLDTTDASIEDFDYLQDYGYNETQIQIIVHGVASGLHMNAVRAYLTPDYPYAKLNWIVSGLVEFYDDFVKINFEQYSADQLEEIYSFFKSGVSNNNLKLTSNISAEKMRVARFALEQGLNVTLSDNEELTIY